MAAPVSIAAKVQAAPTLWTALTVTSPWPLLAPGAYYWAVVAPAVRSLAAGDGALWVGLNVTNPYSPAAAKADASLFSARELRVAGGCASAAALNAVANTTAWATAAGYTNFQAAGSVWRYGISVVGTPRY